MIKLVAIDMDGTLLNSKKEILEETTKYFKDFKSTRITRNKIRK